MCSDLDRREVWSPGWRLVGGKPPQHDEPNLQALPNTTAPTSPLYPARTSGCSSAENLDSEPARMRLDHGIVGNVSRNAISVTGGPVGHGSFIGTPGEVP